MKQIYTGKNYTVEQFNRIRFSISYDGEVVCKYDMTKEAIKMMVDDLVEFMIEDKLIKRKEQNEIKATVKANATLFMEEQKAILAAEAKMRREREREMIEKKHDLARRGFTVETDNMYGSFDKWDD